MAMCGRARACWATANTASPFSGRAKAGRPTPTSPPRSAADPGSGSGACPGSRPGACPGLNPGEPAPLPKPCPARMATSGPLFWGAVLRSRQALRYAPPFDTPRTKSGATQGEGVGGVVGGGVGGVSPHSQPPSSRVARSAYRGGLSEGVPSAGPSIRPALRYAPPFDTPRIKSGATQGEGVGGVVGGGVVGVSTTFPIHLIPSSAKRVSRGRQRGRKGPVRLRYTARKSLRSVPPKPRKIGVKIFNTDKNNHNLKLVELFRCRRILLTGHMI